jgi:protein-tyrosine phosphatase
MGMAFPRTWKTRFFYLNASSDGSVGTLVYYTAEHASESAAPSSQKKGAVSLAGARVSHTHIGRVSGRHDHGFALQLASGKHLNLSAQNGTDRSSWITALTDLIGDSSAASSASGGGTAAAAGSEGPKKESNATKRMRALVSKKKVRFIDEDCGFDLDLTYIDDDRRIIAMGFPSVGVEAAYRNPMKEVQRFFNHYHDGHYRIYNLCSERAYEPSCFDGACERHPFNDHNPCPLQIIYPFCKSASAFLSADPRNVVAVHCKAGKGRTGLMIAALLVHMKYIQEASSPMEATQKALQHFGDARTHNGKGVTIPSQMRYVGYYAKCRAENQTHRYGPKMQIVSIDLTTAPNFDAGGGCDPYFKLERYDEDQGIMIKSYSMIKECKRIGRKLKHANRGTAYDSC